ncbi:phosphotransferase [Spiribacter aquaticus]|uniref:Phosphotransferase n=1 Tax=Spiribacter aquaticus TaxID=1935996 RepID=A0A557RGW3_9GAMM|nr:MULTISPECIES: phosphotransferase [Spiribacter]KAF0280848.1 hypothetical protein BA897_09395 [Spiribacter roseus]TVO64394.1 phosphotransferase [Spiribacter aquaticus]
MATDRLDARGRQMVAWLRDQGIEPDALEVMGGDASPRRYFRIETAGGARVVMDAPDQSSTCRAFCRIRSLMAAAGVHVPVIHAAAPAAGFLLLEDLGGQDYLSALDGESDERLLRAAIDALVQLQGGADGRDLPRFDADRIDAELALFPDWYVRRHLGVEPDAAWWSRWAAGTAVLREAMRAQPTVVVHRDFMVRNLLVATPNPGVIDFQDALVGPVTYDLASLLRDAFFSLTPDAEQALVGYYRDRAAAAGIRLPADLSRALDRTAAQRHLKVLGIFARLYHRDHKPGYLADAPRFLDYLSRELGDDPAGHDLAALIAELPRPERADSP